jgi:DNA-binding MarR family transcriptional regulator
MESLDRDMAPFGLTLADYEVLVHLSEAPDQQLRMAELADLALMSRSRLTYRVDRLVRKGLVDRRPCETDRRGAFAVITAEGQDLLRRAAPIHVLGVRKYLFSSSDSEGWKHAYAASKAMVDACESDELVDIAAQAANGADIILVR